MRRFEIEVDNTEELSIDRIVSINRLKNQYWKYDDEEHMRWFKENIKPDDAHLMIWEGDCLLAYLNIVNVDIAVDQKPLRVMGIGNVCVNSEKEHTGLGMILLSSANAHVKEMNSCGLLLCRDKVKEFYLKSNWSVCKVRKTMILEKPFAGIVMSYDPYRNLPSQMDTLIVNRIF